MFGALCIGESQQRAEKKPHHRPVVFPDHVRHIEEAPLSDCSAPQVGFFSGLFTAVQWHITQCVYCAYDAFSRLDVRCHMAIPGGVIAYAVDCKGQRYGLNVPKLMIPDRCNLIATFSHSDSCMPGHHTLQTWFEAWC